ncbi:MAG: RelA/SpoT family protein [Nanobdellota archaeon]
MANQKKKSPSLSVTEKFLYNPVRLVDYIDENASYLDHKLIKKAYNYAKTAHEGKTRKTGKPYFIHPLNVAKILIDYNLADTSSVCSALLHDVVEDTSKSVDDLKKDFNEEIANLVDGLTKMSKDHFKDSKSFNFDDYNSENMRKIILASAKDVRILFIKLADRLDNMRSLGIFREEKKERIASKTLNIYAPIADKLGLYKIQSELEDLSFLYLKPYAYQYLAKKIRLTNKERRDKTRQTVDFIKNILKKNNINAEVKGRAKNYYSIFKKIKDENKSLDTIYDIYGIRIILDSEGRCYEVFNTLNNLWEIQKDKKTGEKRIKDYIKNPKPNGYRSIHVNYKYEETIIEVQIRTVEMDEEAENGVAKHWRYKENERDRSLDKKISWLKQIISWKRKQKGKYKENLKFDVFSNEIMCITPRGDIVLLKEKSTPLDFAYAIHSKVGHHYEKAFVNKEPALIGQTLKNGDIVEIITSQKPRVNKQWLGIVTTNMAKSKIRQELGMSYENKKSTIKKNNDINEIDRESKIEVIGKKQPIKISKCCSPSYGDEIVGYRTKDGKVTIHKNDCPDQYTLDSKKKVDVRWKTKNENEEVINIISHDAPGVLVKIFDIMVENFIDIKKIETYEKKRNIVITMRLKKDTCSKINEAVKKIKDIKQVFDVNFN